MKKRTVKQKFHFARLLLFLVLGTAVLLARTDGGQGLQLTYNKQVLAYATNMNIGDLLAAANASRAANGLSALTLNSQLNNSAQMKANDMVTDNYWSHVAPDGTQPWYWFQLAGYVYAAAGENLAYGFNNGSEVNTAWMDSPTHRANILGNYVDVGFGIVNGSSFQGDQNTVVVAHYGKPQVAAAAPAPVTTPPTQTPAPTPAPAAAQPVTSTPTEAPTGIPEAPAPEAKDDASKKDDAVIPAAPTNESLPPVTVGEETKNVSVLEQLKNHQTPTIVVASIGLISAASAGYAATHRLFMKKLIKNGQRFMLRHPLLDVIAVCLAIALILSSSTGKLL